MPEKEPAGQAHPAEDGTEPFLGIVAVIRRLTVATAEAKEHLGTPQFQQILVEIGVLAGAVAASEQRSIWCDTNPEARPGQSTSPLGKRSSRRA